MARGYPSGKPVLMDDRQIIAVRKPTTDREDSSTHGGRDRNSDMALTA